MILERLDSEFLRYLLARADEPGSRLPSFSSISAETGISVGKLREQFEVARALGLVDASPRRGIRTLRYDFLPAVRLSLMIALALDPNAFRSYSVLRTHLETAFWDEAVLLLDHADKARLSELVAEAQAKLNLERIQIPYSEHRDFHLTIFCRLNNVFVQGLLEAYWDAYEAAEVNTYADYGYLQEVWGYHARIADAIHAGDFARGKQLLIEHMKLLDRMGVAHEFPVSVHTTQFQGEAV